MDLIDLNIDCQMMIFEFLSAYDLLQLAHVNKNLLVAVEQVLKRRFITKMLIFRAPYDTRELVDARDSVQEFHDHIQVTSQPIVHMILREFGRIISNLKVVHFLLTSETEDQTIYQCINLYCFETLSQLHITNNGNDIFAKLTKQFKVVVQLSLNGHFKRMNNSEFRFVDMFPSLHQLNLDSTTSGVLDVAEQKMPHLNQLKAEIWSSDKIPAIKRLIENNRQIRNLTLISIGPNLLQFIADELVQLEELHIEFYTEENVDVSNVQFKFEQLKRFVMRGTMTVHTIPSNIVFSKHLEVFEAQTVAFPNGARFVEVARKYKMNLKTLRLIMTLDNEEIVEMANAGLNVIEMAFTCGRNFDIRNVVKLIENNESLAMLDLLIDPYIHQWSDFRQFAHETLQQQLPKEWTINETENCIHLKRERDIFE